MIHSVGQVVFDYIFELKEFPKTNSTAYIKSFKELFGGAAGNVAVVCSKLGQKASILSFVGEDFPGSSYEKHLKESGVETKNLRVVKGKTARAFMFNDSKGRQISFFYWGVAERFHRAPIPKLRLGRKDLIHLANGSPSFNMRFAESYPGVSFDPGYDIVAYKRKELAAILENTKFLFCNEFEMSKILRILKMSKQRELFAFPVECIVITKGGRGSRVLTREESFAVPPVKARVVDPTGAGDAYRAAFLAAFMRGESLERCARIASSVASFVVEEYGAQTNIPSWEEAIARLSSA